MTVLLASEALPLPSYRSWIAEQERTLRQEYEWSGLRAALDRQPAESIYPAVEFAALEQAISDDRCLQIAYTSGVETIRGFLVLPPGPARRSPAVVYARGGSLDFGSIGIGSLLDFVRLANSDYVVLATQYRGGPGSTGQDEFGGGDVDDLLNLIPLLRARADVDPRNIFAWGASRGGMMTMLALRQGFRPRAVALRAPMLDLNETARQRDDMRANFQELMPDYPPDPEAALRRRSALAWAQLLPPLPMLLLHGDSDHRVPVTQSVRLQTALRELGRSVELHIYESEGHLLLLNRSDYLNRVCDWFDKHRTN